MRVVGLSERARRRAAELVQDPDLRLSPPRAAKDAPVRAGCNGKTGRESNGRLPLPGTILTRWYKGRTLEVQVLRHGFEYEGQVYQSLSAVAKAVTGADQLWQVTSPASMMGACSTGNCLSTQWPTSM